MALSPSSLSIPVRAGPEQTLNEAIVDFQHVLSNEQRQELHRIREVPNVDAVLVFTAQLDLNIRNKNRRGRSIASNLFSVLQSVSEFSAIIDTFVSSNPEIAALVWGSVKLTMLVRLLGDFYGVRY